MSHRADWWLSEGRQVGGLGKTEEGTKKYKLVVTKQSQGCEVQHGEYGQEHCNNHVWCRTGTRFIGVIA